MTPIPIVGIDHVIITSKLPDTGVQELGLVQKK